MVISLDQLENLTNAMMAIRQEAIISTRVCVCDRFQNAAAYVDLPDATYQVLINAYWDKAVDLGNVDEMTARVQLAECPSALKIYARALSAIARSVNHPETVPDKNLKGYELDCFANSFVDSEIWGRPMRFPSL